MKALIIVLAATMFLLVACKKNEAEYSREAAAHLAAADIRGAEEALRDGLRHYPNSTHLKKEFANLLLKTKRTDELGQYLRTNSFEWMESNWSAVASAEFQRKNWRSSYESFIRAGDSVLMYRPLECSPHAAESYHNAIAAEYNMGGPSYNSYVAEQIGRILRNCDNCETCEPKDKAYVNKIATDLGFNN